MQKSQHLHLKCAWSCSAEALHMELLNSASKHLRSDAKWSLCTLCVRVVQRRAVDHKR